MPLVGKKMFSSSFFFFFLYMKACTLKVLQAEKKKTQALFARVCEHVCVCFEAAVSFFQFNLKCLSSFGELAIPTQ